MKKNVQKLSKNDFTINKVIGEGAYGRAILCKTKSDNSLVVIKEIALSNMSAQEQREAWKETKVLSLLSHPNIISYRGCFMEKNILHIVMEYADGGDLFLQIQNAKNKHFEEEQILEWFAQICLALKHVHDRKILHRDIKCQNIFLTKRGVIKMGDFGIAKILDHTSQLSKTAIGTPYYLSPEICQGKAYNMKSDVWSLGCVLYELCTLQHAFDSKCMNGLIMKILRSKQKPIPFTYSQNLRNLVDSLLQKDPRKRPSVNQILKMDFIKNRIEHLLSATIKKIEFCHTVFHGAKGGETPKDILAEAQKAANAEPNVVANNNIIQKPPQRISSANGNPPSKPPSAGQISKPQHQPPQPSIQQSALEKPKGQQNPPGRPPAQNEIPKMQQRPPPKIQHGLPVNKNPQRNPNSAAVGIAPPSRNQVSNAPQPAAAPVKAFKAKPPRELEKKQSKDDILASKQAKVIEERQRQKEMREKKAMEEKEQEERNERKRAELMEKKAKREAERKAQMEHLKQDARERKKKYDNLEAPFKKAMGGALAPPPAAQPKPRPANNAAPSQPSSAQPNGERPLPKYRESYFDDDELPPDAFPSEDDANKARAPARPKPKLPDKKPAIRPDHVKNREEDQKSLRELMARRRAELRQQKQAEAKAQKEMEAKIAALKAQQAEQPQQQQQSPPPPQPQPQPQQQKPQAPPPQPEPKKEEPPKPEQPKKPQPAPVQQPKPQPQPQQQAPPPQPKNQPPAVTPSISEETQKKLEDLIDIESSDSESEENDMICFYAVMKNILDHPPTSDEEIEEEEEVIDTSGPVDSKNGEISKDGKQYKQQKGVFMFNNKELKLPMVTNNDSLNYRIEALRLFIEQNLGLDKFIDVYRFITVDSDNMTDEEGGERVKQILKTQEELSFYPLIQQLVFCEEESL